MNDDATPRERLRDEQLKVVAAERDRIAGELHDDSVQAMTAVSLQLQRLQGRIRDPEDQALITGARVATDRAIERLRHMLFVLHPSTLDEDGLVVTLDIYLETYVGPEGIEWSVSGDESLQLPVGVAALGFRLAREATSNALRHARAEKIGVTVAVEDHNLVITVIDDGRGIEDFERGARAGHLGLAHCQALAAAALGQFLVTSAPQSGTTVTILLPIPTSIAEARTSTV